MARPAPLGALPAALAAKLKPVAWDAAKLDGGAWSQARDGDLPSEGEAPGWRFRHIKKLTRWDKSQGNFLFAGSAAKPALYVKEVFYPQVLCTGSGGKALWLSTYTGLVRMPLEGQGGPKQ